MNPAGTLNPEKRSSVLREGARQAGYAGRRTFAAHLLGALQKSTDAWFAGSQGKKRRTSERCERLLPVMASKAGPRIAKG